MIFVIFNVDIVPQSMLHSYFGPLRIRNCIARNYVILKESSITETYIIQN